MIYFDDRQENIEIKNELFNIIENIVKHTLENEGVNEEYEISIIFVDNVLIRELNKKYRNIDKETDVLSFPMINYPEKKVFKEVFYNCKLDETYYDNGMLIIGDIALSMEKAKEQSLEFGHSLEREVCYLLIHSILHLLGYDHIEEEDKIRMRNREEEILNIFNITR